MKFLLFPNFPWDNYHLIVVRPQNALAVALAQANATPIAIAIVSKKIVGLLINIRISSHYTLLLQQCIL